MEVLAGLYFEQHCASHDQVRPELSHNSIAKADRQRKLPLDGKSGLLECQGKCLHIDRLQKPVAELVVPVSFEP